jgi:26S proteasome regulatory subunit N7
MVEETNSTTGSSLETKSNKMSASSATTTPMPSASAETTAPYPKMDLAQKIHQMTTLSKEQQQRSTINMIELQEEVFNQIITELENPSLYKLLIEKIGTSNTLKSTLTNEQLIAMEGKNAKEMELLNAKADEAKESAGDMEVMDAKIAIAKFCAKSMSYDETITAYKNVIELSKISSGKKIDCYMELARVASFYGNTIEADNYIAAASKLANDGGGADWDRRNRLKVYKALQMLLHRNTESAASLLLDCVATFSCSEICTYQEFVVFAIITNLLHLPRPELRSKIIDGPEILSIASEIPIVVSSKIFSSPFARSLPLFKQQHNL